MEPTTRSRPEWGLVTVTEDLITASRQLSALASDFQTEARAWTHPAGRAQLEQLALTVADWSQLAALESGRGDYWSRLEALRLATARREVSQLGLAQWWQRGELWNAHRLRPVPASVQALMDRMPA